MKHSGTCVCVGGCGGGWRVCVCKVVLIYIVEVRDRMLTLAASRFSMMALGSEARAVGSEGGKRRGRRDMKDKKR